MVGATQAFGAGPLPGEAPAGADAAAFSFPSEVTDKGVTFPVLLRCLCLLATNPADAKSPIYEYTAWYFNGDEGARCSLWFKKDVVQIRLGQNTTNATAEINIAIQLLKDGALLSFI